MMELPAAARDARRGLPAAPVRGAAIAAVVLAASVVACVTSTADPTVPSAGRFDLAGWKLQIPGPRDIRALGDYRSRYFSLDADGNARFWVDCSETGYTPNAHYVRSELRHLSEWTVAGRAVMAATVKVDSEAVPDKVTVLQIHGTTRAGGNAPPLLRVALNGGDLVAFLKSDAAGVRTERILLARGVGRSWFRCSITVERGALTISVDGSVRVVREVSYWQHPNYFKAGAYPQANRGTVTVTFQSLAVDTSPAP